MSNLSDIYSRFLTCDSVSVDSRSIPSNSIFFALKGENFNGNEFAREALSKGAQYAIVDEKEHALDERFLLVENVLQTLQDLASLHRKNNRVKIIAITGSNGKTTTKELIHKVLQTKYNTLATEKNYNNHIGVPLTLLQLDENTDFAVVEMGANHVGEIRQLCEMADPDFGIITNIGKAHLEGFGSYEGVIRAKSELYDHICHKKGKVFFNQDNPLLFDLLKERECQTFSYGTDKDADIQASLFESFPFLKTKVFDYLIESNLPGVYNFENILASIAVGSYFDVDMANISNAIKEYIPENNRSQIIQTKTNEIILDAYNANPTSMKLALESFHEMSRDKKALILGDMFELGKYSNTEHQKIVELLQQKSFENVFLVGTEFCNTKQNEFTTFRDIQELIQHVQKAPLTHYSILIKGSRGMTLEKITDYL